MVNQNFSIPQEGHGLDYSGVNINIAIGKALKDYSNDDIDGMLNGKADKTIVEEIQHVVNENDKARHTHDNKTILDDIWEADIQNWNQVSGKEDRVNKTNVISATIDAEKYPTAKAVHDFVMDKISGVYDYKGSIKLSDLENPNIAGSGAYYNISETGSRDFIYYTTLDKVSITEINTAVYALTFPYILPDKLKTVSVIDGGSTFLKFKFSDLIHIEGNTYRFEDTESKLALLMNPEAEYHWNTDNLFVEEIIYTVSVNANQGVLSTGRFWEESPALLDLSVFDTSEEVDEKINESVSSIKSEVLTYVDKKTGKITGLGTLSTPPTEYTEGDVGRVYAYVDYTENENGIAKQLYICVQKYVIAGQRTTYLWTEIPFTNELSTQIGHVIHNELPNKQDKDFIVNGEIFIIGTDNNVVVSNADATFAQIRSAYKEGRRVLFHGTGVNAYFPIASVDDTKATFVGVYDLYSLNFYCDVNNTWDGTYYWLMNKEQLDLFLSVYETNIRNLNVNESLKIPHWSAVTNSDGKTLYNFVNESVNDKLSAVYKFKGTTNASYFDNEFLCRDIQVGDVYNAFVNSEEPILYNSATYGLDINCSVFYYDENSDESNEMFIYLDDGNDVILNQGDVIYIPYGSLVYGIPLKAETYKPDMLAWSITPLYSDIDGVVISDALPTGNYKISKIDYTLELSNSDNVVWTGYKWDKLASTIINMDNVVGQATNNGGEIFNDYENNKALSKGSHTEGLNNIAGAKAYRIVNKNDVNKKYILDDVTGLSTGDVYSVRINNHYLNIGAITEINTSEKSVVVDTIVTEALATNIEENSTQNTFYVSEKPHLGTIDIGIAAHAEGDSTMAVNGYAHAEGYNTKALGRYGHSEGNGTESGYAGHSEGRNTKAIGICAHSEGDNTKATGGAAHSEGINTEANGDESHSEGNNTKANGDFSHTEGSGTTADGVASHVEGLGSLSKGDNSHSEGNNTKALGVSAHSEGGNTTAEGDRSHSEGQGSIAKGVNAHAEGFGTEANGVNSHTEGIWTKASANNAHTEGKGTQATGEAQHVQGRWNKVDSTKAHIVGNGTDDSNRSNAHTVDWDGNAWFAGEIEASAIILTSPSGKKFRITVTDDGELVTAIA